MKTSLTRCNECVVFHNWHFKGDWKKSFIKIVTGDFVVRPCSSLFLRSKMSHIFLRTSFFERIDIVYQQSDRLGTEVVIFKTESDVCTSSKQLSSLSV
jgi:hypothetical protein